MDYYNMTDEALVSEARAGSEEAENILLERYKSLVRMKAAAYYMPGADREDIIQEGMIGVFRAIRSYREERSCSFAVFASLCVQRQIISAVRGAGRMKHYPLNTSVSLNRPLSEFEENADPLEEILSTGKENDPAEQCLLKEDLRRIQITRPRILSERESKVWQLYTEGCSYSEIALRLGCSVKAVDNAICRSKKKLSGLLDD